MKCCSRSTLGIAIGSINILLYFGVCIGMIFLYRDSPNKNGKFRFLTALVIIICVAMIATTGLLIYGVIKRLHKLIYPWLVTSGVTFICNCARSLFVAITAIKESTPLQIWFLTLFIDILGLVIQGLIFWIIYSLYRDIGRTNNQHLET